MKRIISLLAFASLAFACNNNNPADPGQKEEPEESSWEQVEAEMPDGISVYRNNKDLCGKKAVAYYAEADLSKIRFDIWSINDPECKGTSDALKTPSQVYDETSAAVIINGGYFYVDGGKRYNASLAVKDGVLLGTNLNYASQDWKSIYYPTRGAFIVHADGSIEVCWTYYTSSGNHYMYSNPAKNGWTLGPKQAPDAHYPEEARVFEAQTAIGAGPVLLKDGEIRNTWKYELFYGEGSDNKDPEDPAPRTAVGIKEGGKLIFFVAEGRSMTEGVYGFSTEEVAQILLELGCTDALNLDGGGSSCMLLNGRETIKVSDGRQRSVASTLMMFAK
ncbi:MAG: phosphodiester glycosidase family protein [Bacteroidales bacterium]|nr:phosphodiester glycosidase family protein [Bacteroidales bacterium]